MWTDHKLLVNYLLQNGCEMLGCKARVWEKLNQFNVEIRYVARKDNIVADVLSRNLMKLSVSLCVKFQSKSVVSIALEQRTCTEIRLLCTCMASAEVALPKKLALYAVNMSIVEGCLYHLWSPHPSASRAETVLQLVVPKKWRAELLTNKHDKAGHFGVVATYD